MTKNYDAIVIGTGQAGPFITRQCATAGMRVAAVSAISNLAEGLSDVPLSHEQTLTDAQRAAGDLARLLEGFAGRLA